MEASEILALGNVVVVSSICSYMKIFGVEAYTSFKIVKTFMGEGGDSFTINLKNQWHFYFTCHFSERYLNKYCPMKLLWQKSVKKQYQGKWSKDF